MKSMKILILITLFIFGSKFTLAKNDIAYSVNIETSNGNTVAVPVPKLETGQYQINAIYVKTKDVINVNKNQFESSDIMNKAFEGMNIKSLNRIASGKSEKFKGTPVERLYMVEYEVGVDSYDLAQELMKNPEVEYAVPVFNRYVTDFTPNDPDIKKQWHLDNLNASKAWEISKGSPTVIIGIVDSAIDWRHPDLLNNIYHNPNEIPDNGIDDDNNGYIDDYTGWDFVGNLTFQQAMNQQYQPDNDPAPIGLSNDHGTHVAGCAAATTNNAIGIASIGFNTKILPVKCGSDNWGGGGTQGIFKGYEGIVYAAENGANIINCSWGGPGYSPAEQEIINSVTAMGVLVIVSAGNDSQNIDEAGFYPAGFNNVLVVGSTNSDNKKSGFSNYGIRTGVFAPGGGIYSTLPGNRYGNKSGTSMASPVTAGLAALVKALHPDWTPHQIASQLRSTTDPISNVSNDNKPLYYGRINALKALQANGGNFATNKTKGMAFSESDFSSNSILDTYDQKTINLKLVNYLAPVSGVKMEFIAMDKFFDIETKEIIENGLNTLESRNIKINIKLNDLNPWFDGFARVLIKFTAEDYTDYQLLKIPIQIKTNNKFNALSGIDEGNYATFYDVHSPDRNSVWAVGQNRSSNDGLIYNSVANRLFPVFGDPTTAVYAFDKYNAWVGTGLGHLLHTTDGGLNWNKLDFSTTTDFFNGVYFFNDKDGVALGDPMNGQFGIVATSNGGNNWTPAPSIASLTGEGGFVGSHCIFGDRVWFGTSKGRVLRGRDFGKNWSSSVVDDNGFILDVAFQNNNNGIAIYNNRSKYGTDVLLAKSNDGGLNWTKEVLNFNKVLGVTPVDLKYDVNSDKIFIFCANGEVYYTENLGSTFVPILTVQGAGYNRADISNEAERYRIYGANEALVSQLDFSLVPEGAVVSLLSLEGDTYNYDSTEINKTNSKVFDFENNGDVTIYVDSVYFTGTDKDAFSFFGNPQEQVNLGNTMKLVVRFKPTEVREYNAKLVIVSNNATGNIVINLTGIGKEKSITSVEFAEFNRNTTIYPMPANNLLNIGVNHNLKFSTINLLDLSGKLLKVVSNDSSSRTIKLDVSNQSSGVYLLQFVTAKGTFYKKVIIE